MARPQCTDSTKDPKAAEAAEVADEVTWLVLFKGTTSWRLVATLGVDREAPSESIARPHENDETPISLPAPQLSLFMEEIR